MKRARWPVIGLVLGAAAGGIWGWFGAGGYEAVDSAVGTGFLCALAGLLIGGVAYHVVGRQEKRR